MDPSGRSTVVIYKVIKIMGNEIKKYFFAAMSSSRSDVVTQFVFPSVRSSVPFFSFSVLEVFSSPKVFQLCFKVV